jgi:hypothetical protein
MAAHRENGERWMLQLTFHFGEKKFHCLQGASDGGEGSVPTAVA